MIDVIYITQNRIELTKQTLPRLSEYKEYFNILIVDNGSNDGTCEYLFKTFPNCKKLMLSRNMGIARVMKDFLAKSNSELVGKIDNDIMLPEDNNWLQNVLNLFANNPRLAVVGLFHFDVEQSLLEGIQKQTKGEILSQPWVGGNFISRRSALIENYQSANGVWGWTESQVGMKAKGWQIGYAWPPVVVKNLGQDDEKRSRLNRGYGLQKESRLEANDRLNLLGIQ